MHYGLPSNFADVSADVVAIRMVARVDLDFGLFSQLGLRTTFFLGDLEEARHITEWN